MIKVMVSDVSPTEPAMMAARIFRPIAMAFRVRR